MAYTETRRHELRKSRMLMIDGHLAVNSRTAESGISARVYRDGYWGFASAPGDAGLPAVTDRALRNARAMTRFGERQPLALPAEVHRGAHEFRGRPALSEAECMERLAELHAWCARRYPELESTRFLLSDEDHAKHVGTDAGADAANRIQRAQCYVTFSALGDDGAPVELSANT